MKIRKNLKSLLVHLTKKVQQEQEKKTKTKQSQIKQKQIKPKFN